MDNSNVLLLLVSFIYEPPTALSFLIGKKKTKKKYNISFMMQNRAYEPRT